MSKPFAWITEKSLQSLSVPLLSQVTLMTALKASQVDEFNIPLYTHPVKQLSDEEIDNIGRQHLTDGDGAIEFARAIIKEITE